MPKIKDIRGLTFGRLTVIAYTGQNHLRQSTWDCVCTCGNKTNVSKLALNSGSTKSCGCLQRTSKLTHGLSRNGTPEYRIWAGVLSRCGKNGHHNYAGRGIKVCERWKSFECFFEDMGSRPSPKHSIDRIDNDGDYEPSNCKWSTKKEQDRNRRTNVLLTLNGETKCTTEWGEIFGIHPMTITRRLQNGWSVEKAITTKVRK